MENKNAYILGRMGSNGGGGGVTEERVKEIAYERVNGVGIAEQSIQVDNGEGSEDGSYVNINPRELNLGNDEGLVSLTISGVRNIDGISVDWDDLADTYKNYEQNDKKQLTVSDGTTEVTVGIDFDTLNRGFVADDEMNKVSLTMGIDGSCLELKQEMVGDVKINCEGISLDVNDEQGYPYSQNIPWYSLPKVLVLTQDEYDSIEMHEPDTYYFIKEA